MKCKYCQREINASNFNNHLRVNHIDEYNKQVELAKQLFFDDNFSEATINNYPDIILSYKVIRNIWKETYNSKERKERMIRCTAMHNTKKKRKKKAYNKGKSPSNEARKKMSLSRIKYLQEHHQLSIHGFRPDIGHGANSTYEANVYRIFQLEDKKYKKETENIFNITFPDGSEHKYIVDICDVDGLFAEPGTYIEIKGYMDERSQLRINCFREQYPQHKLIIIGNKYQKNYTPDIDYRMLENKYRAKIPLWETPHDNIKTNPQKWNVDPNQNNKKINQSTFYCSECGIVYGKRVWTHIQQFHSDIYKQIIELIRKLFYDKNFWPHTYDQYKEQLHGVSYTSVMREWIKAFGPEQVTNRQKLLIPKKEKMLKAFVNCPICGKVHSKWLFTHIKNNHQELYEKIMAIIKDLFFDVNYTMENENKYIDQLFGIRYNTVYAQWKKIFGAQKVSQRTALLKYPNSLNKTRKRPSKIPSAAHQCSICGETNVKRIMNHIKHKHPDKYDSLVQDCNKVFYDKNFTDRTCSTVYYPQLYGISYNTVVRIWEKTYGKNAVSNRMKIIQQKNG